MLFLLKRAEHGSKGSTGAAAANLLFCRQSDTNVRCCTFPDLLAKILSLSQDLALRVCMSREFNMSITLPGSPLIRSLHSVMILQSWLQSRAQDSAGC